MFHTHEVGSSSRVGSTTLRSPQIFAVHDLRVPLFSERHFIVLQLEKYIGFCYDLLKMVETEGDARVRITYH